MFDVQSVYDMPVVQDGPPPGGFPPLRYARRLPSTGPTGFTLFAVAGAIMAYGFVKVGQTNHHRRCSPSHQTCMPSLTAGQLLRVWNLPNTKFPASPGGWLEIAWP